MLTEFAKFSQSRVPVMLAEFARYKRILSADPQLLLRVLSADPHKLLAGIHRNPKARLFETKDAEAKDAMEETTMHYEEKDAMLETTTLSYAKDAMQETTPQAEYRTDATTEMMDETTMAVDRTIEENIEDAVQNILDAIKGALDSFKNEPLSIAAIQSIGVGVFNGIKLIAEELGFTIPSELPDIELPDGPDFNLPDINLPSLPDFPDISLPSLPDFPDLDISLADWPWICKVVWWPHEDEHCQAMRCAACSTAMISAARACEKAEGSASHFCLRRILGDNGCNFCTADYLGY